MKIKNSLMGTMMFVCMFSVTLAPALSTATTPTAITAEAKATLLIKLLDQLRILQAELAALR